MAYFGKEFRHDKDENIEEFVKSLNLTEEQAKGYLAHKPSEILEKEGDEYTLTIGPKVLKFKSGVEFDEQTGPHACKTTITVQGDTVTQVQKYDTGFESSYKREYSGDSLVLTVSNNKRDVEARRYYKA